MRSARLPALVCTIALFFAAGAQAITVLTRGNGAEPKSLDPHFIDLIPESNIVGDLLVGLTTFDPAAHPIPGAADRWSVSADGKTWTFHIRNHLWSDGTPVTAHDFVFAWQRLLDPKTGAYYAYNLWLLKNAHAISNGKLPPSALGVIAQDDSTLVVSLDHPAPYLPELLTHETAYPLPRHTVVALGNKWSRPGSFVGNGAYIPVEWVPNDHITLMKNPRFYDVAHVRIDKVVYVPTQDTQAGLRRYRSGEIDTVTPIPLAQIDWIRKNLRSELHSVPFLGLSYVDINLRHPPLNDARVREALNLAYDRETMTAKVLRFGDKPAYSIVPPNVANFGPDPAMDFARLPYPARIAKARALMVQLGFGPNNPLRTTYATTGEPDSRRIAAVLQAMLKPVYVDLEIVVSDEAVHYRMMQQGQFDLASASWFADFNDASNFLDLMRHDSGNNNGGYNNRKFEAALDSAQAEPDLQKRGRLLADAERIALDDYPWIPVRFRMTQDLVKPYVRGWIENSRQANRSRWLWVDEAPR
jgi:oligopeptide transport system substrate-binding protein